MFGPVLTFSRAAARRREIYNSDHAQSRVAAQEQHPHTDVRGFCANPARRHSRLESGGQRDAHQHPRHTYKATSPGDPHEQVRPRSCLFLSTSTAHPARPVAMPFCCGPRLAKSRGRLLCRHTTHRHRLTGRACCTGAPITFASVARPGRRCGVMVISLGISATDRSLAETCTALNPPHSFKGSRRLCL